MTTTDTAKTFHCSVCKLDKPTNPTGGTGYGEDSDGSLVCYECCGDRDRAELLTSDRATLYLSRGVVTNWPDTLRIVPFRTSKGRHNIAGSRVDVWFKDSAGSTWHGVNIGDHDILRCSKSKSPARSH